MWHVVPKTEQTGTSAAEFVLAAAAVDAATAGIASGVEVVEESEGVPSSDPVDVAYAVVKICANMKEARSRAADAMAGPRPVMLVVVAGSAGSLDDASRIGSGSLLPLSVAEDEAAAVCHCVDEAFASCNAAA